MADLSVLIDRLKRLQAEMPKVAEDIAVAMAQSHEAAVVSRIKTEGIPGESYSEKGVPAYLVEKSPYARQNAGFERMIKRKKKSGEMVSWKDVREANGRQTNFVDFSFSFRTLESLSVVSVQKSGFTATAYIGSTDPDGQFRLNMGYKRYGDFLAPNEQEKELLNSVGKQMIDNKIKEIGL